MLTATNSLRMAMPDATDAVRTAMPDATDAVPRMRPGPGLLHRGLGRNARQRHACRRPSRPARYRKQPLQGLPEGPAHRTDGRLKVIQNHCSTIAERAEWRKNSTHP